MNKRMQKVIVIILAVVMLLGIVVPAISLLV